MIIALILIATAILYLQQYSPNKFYTGTPVTPGNRTAINAEKAQKYEYAKEIAKPSGFVNVDNITVSSMIGRKVILLDFWTYSCINCERTIPYRYMEFYWPICREPGICRHHIPVRCKKCLLRREC